MFTAAVDQKKSFLHILQDERQSSPWNCRDVDVSERMHTCSGYEDIRQVDWDAANGGGTTLCHYLRWH